MLFLVALFLIKNKTIFQNAVSFIRSKQENGLTYNSNATIEDLVNKDTDQDGVLDWEEGLWGTDPTKRETTPGISDRVAIEKIKMQQTAGVDEQGLPLLNGEGQKTENLTQTDKFSQELFATVASLNQNGTMDQATVDKISSSLAEQIQNSTPKKIYLLSDIKIVENDTPEAVKKYNNTLDGLQNKYPTKHSALDVLQEFAGDENNINSDALNDLDPIIKQLKGIISDIVGTSVPQSLSTLHLDFLNSLERLLENLNDIKLYDADVIVSLRAISQYNNNTDALAIAVNNLENAISEKLK